MSNPTRIDAGLSKELLERARQQQVVKEQANILKMEIVYDFQKGTVQFNGAPSDPVLFFGVMQVASDTYRILLGQMREQAAAKAKSEVAQ